MGQAIGDSLPSAVSVAIGPLPIATPPTRMGALDAFARAKAGGAEALLSALNPENLLLKLVGNPISGFPS